MAGGDHRRGDHLPPAPASGAHPAGAGAGGRHGLHLPGKDPSGGAFHLPPASGSPAPVPHRPAVCAAGRGAGPRQRRAPSCGRWTPSTPTACCSPAAAPTPTAGRRCARPWGPCSAAPSIPAHRRNWRPCCTAAACPWYGAALREDTVDARQADYTRCTLAIGSEGRGLSREVLNLCGQTIRIPMSDRCESLNAAIAAAVLLWESWR